LDILTIIPRNSARCIHIAYDKAKKLTSGIPYKVYNTMEYITKGKKDIAVETQPTIE